MHTPKPKRTLVSKILGFGATALLAAAASASAAEDVWIGLPATTPSAPVWYPAALPLLPVANWSTGAPPTGADDAIFPSTIPTFPFLDAAPAPLNQFANGKTILTISLPQNIAPPGFPSVQLTANSLTFQNNYRLIDVFTLIPAPLLPLLPFSSAPIVLSNGNVTVTKGSTAEIDGGLQSLNGTITKLGNHDCFTVCVVSRRSSLRCMPPCSAIERSRLITRHTVRYGANQRMKYTHG